MLSVVFPDVSVPFLCNMDCLIDLLDCAATSAILLIYFDVSITCYRVIVGDCACGNLKERRGSGRGSTIKQDSSVSGRPAKNSADKSQDEFLMQSPPACWMLQRRH